MEKEDSQKQFFGHDEDNTTYIKFLLANAEAGLIIGKGGCTVNDFQSRSGARIQFSRPNEYFPGTLDRIITVSGTVESVLSAADLIFAKIIDETYCDDVGDAEPRSRYNLVVPSICCGRLIGKGGNTIKSLVSDSGASIKISPPEVMYRGLYERLLMLVGTIGEQMHALESILLILSEDPKYIQSYSPPLYKAAGYNNMTDKSNGGGSKFQNNKFHYKAERTSSVTFGVADELMGFVLGRGGRSLTEISQFTGAKIKVSSRGDFMPGTFDRKVTISGSPRAVYDAEAMITRKVAFGSDR
ncbi:RNA metabolism protein [Lithospermum erythrorhizon]|uniref:RNA metabolism protein n=1 Tax=Lithospermum erythrorhizon TaxID=34254 RepID=A0AAV3R8B2_LITER